MSHRNAVHEMHSLVSFFFFFSFLVDSEADKSTPAELRLQKTIEFLKLYQGQQVVLGSALHTIMEKLEQENEQIDDQHAVLASSFKALIENVATRADMEEIQVRCFRFLCLLLGSLFFLTQTAAGEDNELHVELEDSTKKVWLCCGSLSFFSSIFRFIPAQRVD